MQWVVGDRERGLLIPLAEFDVSMCSGKDASGKNNKHLYRKTRRLSAATSLALQDAYENEISVMDAIGLQNAAGKEPEQITL